MNCHPYKAMHSDWVIKKYTSEYYFTHNKNHRIFDTFLSK